MKSAVAGDAKVWFLASGTKKIGPLSEARLLERIAEGKVSPKMKAWKEGMGEWTPVGSIPEFSRTTRTLLSDSGTVEKAEKPAVKPKSGSRITASRAEAAAASRKTEAFVQPYRIERADLWRAFELGFEVPRIKVALGAFGGLIGVGVFVLVAAWLHVILGALAALAALPLSLGVTAIAMGALSYQTRRAVETGTTPTAGEALSFAKDHAVALVISPVLVSLLALAPPVALVVKSLLSRVPTVGPPAAGLTFGVDLALTALMLFLGVASSLAWHFVPSIVACEEQGAIGTVRALLGIVRTRIARIMLWPARSSMALSALTFALVLIAAVVTVVPALLNSSALGLDTSNLSKVSPPSLDFDGLDRMGGDGIDGAKGDEMDAESRPEIAPRSSRTPAPAPRFTPKSSKPSFLSQATSAFTPGIGLVGVVLWTALLFAIVAAIVVSTANALTGLLYLGCRPGNDDLITRDSWIAQRHGGIHASN